MKKKLFLSLGALGTAVAILPMFAAFEAHVVNVTARIENALSVSTKDIDFGTVFPQEHLDKPLVVQLSQSFFDEPRVDDVRYFIRQKPKCALTNEEGTEIVGPTATGHVNVDGQGNVTIDCGPAPKDVSGVLLPGVWDVLPSLCEYISKEGDTDVVNDETTPSFHEPWTVDDGKIVWNDTGGYLAKSVQDVVDTWNIDLAVPCFGGYCAQDWASYVAKINPNAGDPDQWTQPIANEHKVFGCDLWIEVSGVSTSTPSNP